MNSISDLFNPFAARFVESPRKVPASVASLNHEALERLVQRVRFLAHSQKSGQLPPPLPAIRILSPEPGCGKSHLLGRLFTELRTDATRIYVQPFGNEGTAWTSLLQQTLKEMSYPDLGATDYCETGELNQLDAFASGVLAYIAAVYIESEEPCYSEFLRALLANPLEKMALAEKDSPARIWIDQHFDTLTHFASSRFHARGLTLSGDNKLRSWLRVLFLYACSARNPDLRETCLDWLKLKSVPEDANNLRIETKECERLETSAAEREEKCRHRIRDLTMLATVFRPFVFCFDQTETYGQRPELTRIFGQLIGEMVSKVPNQLTVVTANWEVWSSRLQPHMEQADLDRMNDTVTLKLMGQTEAQDLLSLRLESVAAPPEVHAHFHEGGFQGEVFKHGPVSVRRFLEAAALHYETFKAHGVEGRGPLTGVLLKTVFEEERQALITRPRGLDYSPDILHWFIETLPDRAHPARQSCVSFPLKWSLSASDIIYICLEEGAHHFKWKAIAQESQRLSKQVSTRKCMALRTSEQELIPRKTWKAIGPIVRNAQATNLEIRILSREETADIYAAWALYSKACQGDIDHATEDVLRFCRQQLRPLGKNLAAAYNREQPAPSPRTDPSSDLIKRIKIAVRDARFIGFEQLVAHLGGTVSLEQAIRASGSIPQITTVPHPNTAVFLWS